MRTKSEIELLKRKEEFTRHCKRLYPMEESKPTLKAFFKKYWIVLTLAPMVLVALTASIVLGMPSRAWLIVFSALMVFVGMLLGGWIRNAWLKYTGAVKVDTTKYEPDGSIHTLEVQDKEGPLRDRWGNRLFNEGQMLTWGTDCWEQDVTPSKSALDWWVNANKIP